MCVAAVDEVDDDDDDVKENATAAAAADADTVAAAAVVDICGDKGADCCDVGWWAALAENDGLRIGAGLKPFTGYNGYYRPAIRTQSRFSLLYQIPCIKEEREFFSFFKYFV